LKQLLSQNFGGPMLNYLKNLKYQNNTNGLVYFAEKCMTEVVAQMVRFGRSSRAKAQKQKTRIEWLNVRAEEIMQHGIIEENLFSSTESKIKRTNLIFAILFLAELSLNYFAVEIFMPGKGLLMALPKVSLSLALTLGAIYSAEMFIGFLMHFIEKLSSQKNDHHHNDNIWVMGAKLVFWSILFGFAETTVVGISHLRAVDIEGASEGMLYNSMIFLSLLLPVVGGYMYWERIKLQDAYKRTVEYHNIQRRMMDMDEHMRILTENESLYMKALIQKSYAKLMDFRAAKENRDLKKASAQNGSAPQIATLEGTFAETLACYEHEAIRRYNANLLEEGSALAKRRLNARKRNEYQPQSMPIPHDVHARDPLSRNGKKLHLDTNPLN